MDPRLMAAILGFNVTFVTYLLIFNRDYMSESFFTNLLIGAGIGAVVAAVAWVAVNASKK